MKKICVGCKNEFQTNNRRIKYCSRDCYLKKHVVWNKNLTKETDERVKKYTKKRKERIHLKKKDLNINEILKFCECGCGEVVKNGNKFIHGHNNRNIKFSKRHRQKIKEALINQPKSDKARENMSKTKTQMFKEGLLQIPSKAFKKGNVPWIKDKKHTKTSLKKMSIAHKGNLLGKDNPAKRPGVREIIRLGKLGDKNPNWKGGSSFEPYDENWTDKFKRAIRRRDNQICMLCGIHREKLNRALDVHHVNYNKKLSIPQNCISLCRKCHNSMVHGDKDKLKSWAKFFQDLLAKKYDYQYSKNEEIILEVRNEN